MTDRPILFSAPMVKAIMREIKRPGSGKTQTRRMLKCTVMGLPEPEFGGWYGTTAALAELAGMDPRNPPPAIRFAWLWNQINGERDGARWADNPWVVAVSFTPHLRNIDDTSASKVAA